MIGKLMSAVLASACAVGAAQAEPYVHRHYTGVATAVDGPLAGHFTVGERVLVSLSIDPLTPDIDPDPTRGVYQQRLGTMTVLLPQSRQRIQMLPDSVQVHDGVVDSVYYFGQTQIGGTLYNQAPLWFVALALRSEIVEDGVVSQLVDSDAIVTDPIRAPKDTQLILFDRNFVSTPLTLSTRP